MDEGVVVDATVVGIDQLRAEDFFNGGDLGVIYNGLPEADLPEGYYLFRVFLDRDTREAEIVLIDLEGNEFEMRAGTEVIPGDVPFAMMGPAEPSRSTMVWCR